MNRVPVAPGWEEAFEGRFRRRAGSIERQPGFLRLQILRPAGEGPPRGEQAREYVVLTCWRDRAAFEAWVGSEDFRAAHAGPHRLPPEAFRGQARMEAYEVALEAGPDGAGPGPAGR